MDHLVQQGQEIAFRLGYDDINESLTHPDIVRRTLLSLGATKQALRSGSSHSAFDGITRLGLTSTVSSSFINGAAPSEHFDVQRAAVFWSQHVFVKTFYERRSWLAMFRAFYRVFCLQAVIIHVLVAAAFTEGSWSGRPAWNAMSSAVITHAAFSFLERFANLWMNQKQRNPVDSQSAAWEWMEGKIKGKR